MQRIPSRSSYSTSVFAGACSAAALALLLGISGCSAHSAKRTDSPRQKAQPSAADLVIVNAKVWTGASDNVEAGSEKTGWIAIRGNRIVAVGGNADVQEFVGPHTKVLDAYQRRVIPGLTDCHTHVIGGGLQLARLYLRDVANQQEFIDAIARRAKETPKDQWVLGGRWSTESWPDPSQPTKEWIDPVTGDTPVYLSRMDGHSALVNSAALKIAGIDSNGPEDPKGGEIERDPQTGEPTGILKESAKGLVSRHIPRIDAEQRYQALRRAMSHANSLGVTGVEDMCSPKDLDAYRRAEESGELTLRTTVYLSVDDWEAWADRIAELDLNSEMFRLAGFKGYMDGSMGSRTAYMRGPYADATSDMPYPRGQLSAFADPLPEFQQTVAMADRQRLQLALHAIGDEANHQALNAFEYSARRNGRRDARHRIEHAQHLLVSDIPRFAELGVVASMQPYHKADDGRYCERAIGKERLKGSYAFRQLVDSNALLVFGSDWPVVSLNPFLGMAAAVNARTLAGDVWLASHSLTVDEALRCYTTSAAQAVHREHQLGTIEVGQLADLVILSDDPFSIPKDDLGKIRAMQTIVDGKIVFTR